MDVLLKFHHQGTRVDIWGHRLHHQHRRLVCGLRLCRADVGAAHLPRGQRGGPAGGDHQGPGDAHQGTDQGDESKLHRVQVSPDQGAPLAQGKNPRPSRDQLIIGAVTIV